MSDNERQSAKLLPLPDVGDFVFLFVIWLSLFVLPNMLFTDGSTGWHLVAGDYILQTGTIPHTDLFSNTFPDKPWVAYEWLFDVFIALLVKVGGLKLLAVTLSSLIGWLFLSIYDRSRKNECNIAMSFFLVIVAILTSATHWLARPHLVMFVCIWIFVTHLEDFYQGIITRNRLFITLALTMLVWVNCHPGFIVGFIILGIYLFSTLMQTLFDNVEAERTANKHKFVSITILCAMLAAASFVNPYGIELHKYIFQYMRGSEVIAATNEFLSPVFKGGLHPTCLEILFFAFACGLFLTKKRISLPAFLTCLAFGHAALSAVRSMPLFAIAATSTIASLWAPAPALVPVELHATEPGSESDTTDPTGTKSSVESDTASATNTESGSKSSTVGGASPISKLVKSLKDFNDQEAHCKMHIVPILCTLVLIVFAMTGNPAIKSDFDPSCMPVATLKYIQDNKLDPKKGFNFDNWGGLLRYKLNERVFIDDRADFYGTKFYTEYSIVMAAGEGWDKILNDRHIDWVLFPKDSKLTQTLKQSPNWKLASSDEASELYLRTIPTQK